jgi:hypothetical protein
MEKIKLSSIIKKNPHININDYKKNKAILNKLRKCGLSVKKYELSSLTRKSIKTDNDESIDYRAIKL